MSAVYQAQFQGTSVNPEERPLLLWHLHWDGGDNKHDEQVKEAEGRASMKWERQTRRGCWESGLRGVTWEVREQRLEEREPVTRSGRGTAQASPKGQFKEQFKGSKEAKEMGEEWAKRGLETSIRR